MRSRGWILTQYTGVMKTGKLQIDVHAGRGSRDDEGRGWKMFQQGTVLEVVSEPPEAGTEAGKDCPSQPSGETKAVDISFSDFRRQKLCDRPYCLSPRICTALFPQPQAVKPYAPVFQEVMKTGTSCGGLPAGYYISLSLKSYLMCLLKIGTPFLIYWDCSHLEIVLMLVVEMVFFCLPNHLGWRAITYIRRVRIMERKVRLPGHKIRGFPLKCWFCTWPGTLCPP